MTSAELAAEAAEYFDNPTTQAAFPDAFSTVADFVAAYRRGIVRPLSHAEIARLDNSDVARVINDENPRAYAEELSREYGRDLDGIMDRLTQGQTPYPIVLRHGSDLYLLGGNTASDFRG